MQLDDKQLVRIADSIREQLKLLQIARHRNVQQKIIKLNETQQRLAIVQRKLGHTLSRRWGITANKLVKGIPSILRDIPSAITELEHAVKKTTTRLPTTREVYKELRQLEREFGQYKYNDAAESLSVLTDPIELEDVYLGEFEICLRISDIAESDKHNNYRIIALNPNPAATNDTVTHPHVSDEYLCAGDAMVPLQAALAEGRICDFFIIVRSVLQTYNPSSPYVSLDEWHGRPCYECGYVCDDDDAYYCENCGNEFCGECSSYCHSCDTSMCLGCLDTCPVCGEYCCEACILACSVCGELMCLDCLENNICNSCREEMENHNEEENEIEEPTIPPQQPQSADPAVLTNGLG